MKIGAENKKSVYALIVLGVFAAYMVYSQFFSGPTYQPARLPAASNSADKGPDISQAAEKVTRGKSHSKNEEFRPKLIPKKNDDRARVDDLDPSIRLDLLDKVMKVPAAGGQRDLFTISRTPPVKTELAGVEPIVKPYRFVGPLQPPPPPPPPGPPPPLPLTPPPFKYYGFIVTRPNGRRTAYFMEGDEIMMANEGAVLKGRWRIVQIGLDKVLVEDTHDKRQQPLKIEPEPTS